MMRAVDPGRKAAALKEPEDWPLPFCPLGDRPGGCAVAEVGSLRSGMGQEEEPPTSKAALPIR